MKKILILMMLCLFIQGAWAQTMDVAERISLKATEITLGETFKQIEEQTDISFAYNSAILDNKKYNWDFNNKPISKILDVITRQSGLSYSVKSTYILIKKLVPTEAAGTETQFKAIRGRIADEETGEFLPFATIRIKGTGKGVVSNEVGEFALNLEDQYQTSSILISFMGYFNKEVPVATFGEEILNIALEQNVINLAEVEVTPLDPLDILSDAIDKVKENYPTQPFGYNAYYRELVKVDSSFVKYADAAAYIYNFGYQQTDPKQDLPRYGDLRGVVPFPEAEWLFYGQVRRKQVKIIEARASENLQKLSANWHLNFFEQFNISYGIQKTLGSDYVKTPLQFLDRNKWPYYEFELEEYTYFNDKRVYAISFRPKARKIKKSLVSGRMYIDINSSAIVSYEFEVPEVYHKKLKKDRWIKFIGTVPKKYRSATGGRSMIRRTMTDYNHRIKVSFQEFEGKWYLSNVSNTGSYQNFGPPVEDMWFETTRELIINEILTGEQSPIPKNELFTEQLFSYPTSYSAAFWQRYNAVLPSGIFAEALEDLEKNKSLEQQFKDNVTKDTTLLPPVARKIPVTQTIHGTTLTDEYQWLQQPFEEEVQQYIDAENNYTRNYMIPLEKRRRFLYREMVDRVKKNDESVPVKLDDYYYYTRYVDSLNYPIYCRKYQTTDAPEEIIQDVNQMAEGYEYYDLSLGSPSPDHTILPFYENLTGGFESTLKFKNLRDHQFIQDSLLEVNSLVWFESGDAFLYTRQAPESKRSCQVYLHRLGTQQSTDELVYEEKDETFSVSVGRTKSKKYLLIYTGSNDENEVYLLDAQSPNMGKKLFLPRMQGHQYGLTHVGDAFYISSNQDAPNYQLFTTSDKNWGRKDWDLLIPHNPKRLLEGFQVFDNHIVILEKENAQNYMSILNLTTRNKKALKFGNNPHVISLRANPDPGTESFRFSYEDPLTPPVVYGYKFETGEKTVIKATKVQGFYDAKEYKMKKVFAVGQDGVQIPVTLIYKKGAEKPSFRKVNGQKTPNTRRLYLTGYGAYGVGSEPYFSYSRLSLLDRNVIYAIAHVRGGDDKGEAWYQDGKLLNKKNTFKDFISVAEHLIAEDYIEKGSIVAAGGSAGGLLVGAVVNERPDLFMAAVLDVPFLDVINSMLDEDLPLTTGEYKEWGNPREKTYFDYMKSYAPYENIKAQDYPHMYFTCALNDDNVPYWEAVKTVARLRATKTDDREILLKVNRSGGHGGGSRRFDSFADSSSEYAFLIDLWSRRSRSGMQRPNGL